MSRAADILTPAERVERAEKVVHVWVPSGTARQR